MSTEPIAFRCGAAARERNDGLAGTAAPASGFLLVEQGGAWARRAFEDNRDDPAAGRRIVARARESGLRPLFIRRHGRSDDQQPPRFAVVDVLRATVGWQKYAKLAELADADWRADDPLSEPLFLTCTHGRHDQCCAIAGRPVAAQFAKLRPERSFECSHLGGDRFAGNVLVLPYGVIYGFVDPLDVPTIITASERAELHLPLLRGTTPDSPAEQVARIWARRELGRTRIEDLPVLASQATGPGRWAVQLADGAAEAGSAIVTVAVSERRVADQRATCAQAQPGAMREFNAEIVVRS